MKKSRKGNLVVITERYRKGDATTLFAKVPLFNKEVNDLNGSEILLLSWIVMSKYSSNNRDDVVYTYEELARILGTTRYIIKKAADSLKEKDLITSTPGSSHTNDGIVFGHSVRVPNREYQTMTKALVTTNIFGFKLKGFIAALLITGNDYVIDVGSATDIAGLIGVTRQTAGKHIATLDEMGFLTHTDHGKLLDLRSIVTKTIDAALDRMVVAEKKVDGLEKKVDKLIDLIVTSGVLEANKKLKELEND